MTNDSNLIDTINTIAENMKQLRDNAFSQYSVIVDQVVNNQITDEQTLERIMDGLSDFCDESRFIALYRNLCRHIFYHYPQLVGEHVTLFRAQFETAEDGP